MNTTRSFWSTNCCKYRQHGEYVFIATTVLAFLIPVLFYVLAKVYTDKKVATVLPRKLTFKCFKLQLTTFFSLQKTDLLVLLQLWMEGEFNVSSDFLYIYLFIVYTIFISSKELCLLQRLSY